MSPANVYRFFRSKRAIDEAVAKNVFNEMLAEIIEAVPGRQLSDYEASCWPSALVLSCKRRMSRTCEASSQTQYA